MGRRLVSSPGDPELGQRIRDAYAAFASGQVERVLEFFHKDALYVNPPYVLQIDDEGLVTQLAWYGSSEEAAGAAGL